MKHCARRRNESVEIVGMIGKLSKMADGKMQTHAAGSEVNMALLASLAAEIGAPAELYQRILAANTARHVLNMCKESGVTGLTAMICQKVVEHTQRHAGDSVQIDAYLIDFNGMPLGHFPPEAGARLEDRVNERHAPDDCERTKYRRRQLCDYRSRSRGASLCSGAMADSTARNPFYYYDNLRQLENAGAELVYFSPIHDEYLPAIDGLYLGGGYSEVYAVQLAENRSMRQDIHCFARDGGTIYAECGGLIYLCSSMCTLDGAVHPMCNVLPGETTMCERLQALGYVEVETVCDSVLGFAGARFRGHQFRYSNLEIEENSVTKAYAVTHRRNDTSFMEGYQVKSVLASYVHAHWASSPLIPVALVDACSHSGNRSVGK